MKLPKIILYAVVLFLNSLNAAVIPFKEKGEVVIFDAGINKIKDVKNYTTHWIKGSNLTPHTKLVEENGLKWIQFSYSGKNGRGISRIDITKDVLSSLKKKGKKYNGIKFKIAYNSPNFEKVQIQAFFTDKSNLVAYPPLKKGTKEYSITKGFRHCKYPPDWNKLKFIWLAVKRPGASFMLQKITMIEGSDKRLMKALKITGERKIKEIFPAQKPIFSGGNINPKCFENAAELTNFYSHKKQKMLKRSPFKSRICYDQKSIAIETKAEFKSSPQANVKKHDGSVYLDEALEYFFSPWLDNNRKMQFVLNAAGTTFDYIRDYDRTASKIINIIAWSLPHKQKLQYKENVWETNVVFSLKDLNIDSSKNRLVPFQLVQNYHTTQKGKNKFNPLCWALTKKFPDATKFGILVFNKKAFGQGKVKIKEIKSFEKNERLIDLKVNYLVNGFKPGNYKLRKTVVSADYTVHNQEENINIKTGNDELSANLKSIKNIKGIYTIYLSFHNRNNDIKAAAVNFENSPQLKDMFGKTLFCPTPKKVEYGKETLKVADYNTIVIPGNATERTIKTAQIFSKDLRGFTASKNRIKQTNKEIEKSIELKIAKTAKFKGKETVLKKEAYCLEMTPRKIIITGADEPGLYYGCISLLQLIKMPMKFIDGAPVKSANILDWPDTENRMLRLPHPWHYRGKKFKEVRNIGFLKNWVGRFVAGNKFNRLYLDITQLVKFKRRPEFCGSERIYTLEDIRELAEYCHDRFVEIIIASQVGGHANWWLLRYHPELRETGYQCTSDYTHPEHNKIVFDCMLDLIEAAKAKYASPKSDECWQHKNKKENPEPKLRGKTRSEAFLDFHVKLNNFLKKHGVKMLIFEDMLNPHHNGKRYDLYKLIDKFPKDIIISPWNGAWPDLAANYFIDRGFEIWGSPTGYWTYGEKAKNRVKGFGASAYKFGTAYTLFRKSLTFSAYEQFMGADAAWNLKRPTEPDLINEVVSGRLVALREMYALQPNPHASEKITPIDIQKSMNRSFLEVIQKNTPGLDIIDMPRGKSVIGNIATLMSKNTDNCILLPKGSSAEFTIGKKFSSLIFLHTGCITPEAAKNFKAYWRDWIYGYPLGDYLITYSDGKVEKLPVRLKWEINWMDEDPLFRTTVNNRYILPIKLSDNSYRFIYQWEWVNPYPHKKIKNITYKHDNNFDFSLLLFALSGREVKPKSEQINLALGKKYTCSDKHPSAEWHAGLTDGRKTAKDADGKIGGFATGKSPDFPKEVVIDLEKISPINKVLVYNMKKYGTKTVEVSLSKDGKTFKKAGSQKFRKADGNVYKYNFPQEEARFVKIVFLDYYKTSLNSNYMFLREVEVF